MITHFARLSPQHLAFQSKGHIFTDIIEIYEETPSKLNHSKQSCIQCTYPVHSSFFGVVFTDMIDGTVAGKTVSDSKFGARLDTFADFVFVLVCSIKILPIIHIPVWLWVWISIIALIKMFNFALVFVRKKELLSIHSTLNKVTGFALFILPLSLTFIEPLYSVTAICILATIAAMQEVYFVSKTDKTTY